MSYLGGREVERGGRAVADDPAVAELRTNPFLDALRSKKGTHNKTW